MVDLIVSAIPAFVVLLAVEIVTLKLMRHEGEGAPIGYDVRDSSTSIALGLGKVAGDIFWKIVVAAAYVALYRFAPLKLSAGVWWTWVLLFFADDLSYYVYHRASHRVRIFWATHVVHHSSEHYNLSTALRQPWTPFDNIIFWAWMPLAGFPVWTIFLAQAWNLLYQFWIHTETIGRMPSWYEAIFNTPSHHRVHHGSQTQYLDRNYAGILIVWDRLFGSFEPEGERVRYGLTINIGTFNPVRAAFHEYVAIWNDVRAARNWRHSLGYLLCGPGWQPSHRQPEQRGSTGRFEPKEMA